MKGKNWIANKFQIDLKNVDPNGGNVAKKKFKVYAIFLSWKLLKLRPQTRFKVFFQKDMPSVPVKHHFPYLSLH
jgi:hypothetical protein